MVVWLPNASPPSLQNKALLDGTATVPSPPVHGGDPRVPLVGLSLRYTKCLVLFRWSLKGDSVHGRSILV
ncbi:hypothetical protein AVEN_169976-1, partial [Araneus ventricosus]